MSNLISQKERIYFGEFNQEVFEAYITTAWCDYVVQAVEAFRALERPTTKEEQLVKFVIPEDSTKLAQQIGFALFTGFDSYPIESAIGTIASVILAGEKGEQLVIAANQVAAEFIFFTSDNMATDYTLFNAYLTMNGHYKVRNLYVSKEETTKTFYPLPEDRPTMKHRTLGKYNWTSTYLDSVKKLNNTAFTLLDIPEMEPFATLPQEQKELEEDWIKWKVRQVICPQIKSKRFYFNWHQDYRGRMNAGGYHLHPQGNEYEKNILAFADIQEINFAGKQQIKYAIARAFKVWRNTPQIETVNREIESVEIQLEYVSGIVATRAKKKLAALTDKLEALKTPMVLDKATDVEKGKWYLENAHHLSKYVHEAKHPTEAKAQLMSMDMVNTHGFTNIPVELDATNSQLQMVAVLVGDLMTAKTCNIVSDNSTIADAYAILAQHMSEILGLKFNREQIKKAQMIDGYGAGEKLVTAQLQEDLKELFSDKAVEAFYAAQNKMSPAVQLLKETFRSIWDKKRTQFNWTMPNGFVVDYRPVDTYNIKVNPFGLGEITLKAKIAKEQTKDTGLGVNIIHSCDAFVASEMIMKHKNNQIWTIHDGFKVHPNDAKHALANYNEIMADIADSNLLESIIYQISGQVIPLNKQFTGVQVKEAKYSIS